MDFAIISVILILLLAVVSTMLVLGKSDAEYRKNTKRNTMNLTIIYVVVILLSFIAVAIYIRWYA